MCILITEIMVEFNSIQDLGFRVACFLATDDIVTQKYILQGKKTTFEYFLLTWTI